MSESKPKFLLMLTEDEADMLCEAARLLQQQLVEDCLDTTPRYIAAFKTFNAKVGEIKAELIEREGGGLK